MSKEKSFYRSPKHFVLLQVDLEDLEDVPKLYDELTKMFAEAIDEINAKKDKKMLAKAREEAINEDLAKARR